MVVSLKEMKTEPTDEDLDTNHWNTIASSDDKNPDEWWHYESAIRSNHQLLCSCIKEQWYCLLTSDMKRVFSWRTDCQITCNTSREEFPIRSSKPGHVCFKSLRSNSSIKSSVFTLVKIHPCFCSINPHQNEYEHQHLWNSMHSNHELLLSIEPVLIHPSLIYLGSPMLSLLTHYHIHSFLSPKDFFPIGPVYTPDNLSDDSSNDRPFVLIEFEYSVNTLFPIIWNKWQTNKHNLFRIPGTQLSRISQYLELESNTVITS